jgi:hypothetical protein
MTEPIPPDVHAPYVQHLVSAGDWAGLVRYSMAHQHLPALDAAVGLVSRQATSKAGSEGNWWRRLVNLGRPTKLGSKEGDRWSTLARFLAEVRQNPLNPRQQLSKDLLTVWSPTEQVTLGLVMLFPRVALCELAGQYPIEDQERLYRVGLQSAAEAFDLAVRLQDPAAAAFFGDNIGRGCQGLHALEAARDSFQEALASYRELARLRPDVYRPYVAMTLNNLGNVQRALNALEAARDSYQEALASYRDLARLRPDVYRPDVATTLTNLGLVQHDLNALEAAHDSFHQATDLYDADAPSRPTAHLVERQRCWNNLGQLYLRQDPSLRWPDYHQARAAFRRANACTEHFRSLFLDQRQRQRVQGEALHIAEALVQTCVHISEVSQDSDSLREAVEVAEASRARNLMELIAKEALQPANTPPDLIDEHADWHRRLRQAERRLYGESKEPRSEERLRVQQSEVDGLRRQYQAVLERIRSQHDPEFTPDQPVPPISFPDAVGLIPDDKPTAVVQYSLTRGKGLALVVTRQDVQAVVLPDLNDRQASERAYAWFLAYQYYKIRNNRQNPDRLEDAARALQKVMPRYEAAFGNGRAQALRELLAGTTTWEAALPVLLEPVAERVVWPVVQALAQRGIGRLILSPNRGLHVFPLHACHLAESRYLSDAFEVVYTPSLSILHRCASRRRGERSRLCLVENPTCDLTFTELEGARLRERYRPPEVAWLYGGGATREEFLKRSRDCHVLAYTGHAGFDAGDPLNSALVLGRDDAPACG